MKYFPREHALDARRISDAQLDEFENQDIVRGTPKAGQVFYTSRDLYRTRRNLFSIPRILLMSGSNGIDPTRLRQLRAIIENLCMLAKRHRENNNYVVAHALYGRALAVAQDIHTPDDDGSSLASRIRRDQGTVLDLTRSGEDPEIPLLEKAKEAGRQSRSGQPSSELLTADIVP